MPKKNIKFYSEVVLVTILSLVAANVWIKFVTKTIKNKYGNDLTVYLLVAIAATLFAILILNFGFSSNDEIIIGNPSKHNNKGMLYEQFQ